VGRLDERSAEARALAESVAVLESAELRVAAQLAGLDGTAAEEAADELFEAGLLWRGRPLRYAHSLLGSAVQEALGPARRGSLHRRAAELLDAEDADRAAAHLLFSEPAGEAWAVERLRAAAERELERGAPDAAVELLERALAEPAGEARVEVLAQLGRAEALVGRYADAAAHLGEAAQGSEPEQRPALMYGKAIACTMDNRAEEGMAALEAALEEPSTAPEERHRLEVALAMVSAAHPNLTGPGFARLERVAARTRADSDSARLLLAIAAYADYWQARVPGAEVAGRIEGLIEESDDLFEGELSTGVINHWCVVAVYHADRVEAALRMVEEMEASGRLRASVAQISTALCTRARIMSALGQLSEAELMTRRTLEMESESMHPFGFPVVVGGLAEMLVESGRPEEAEAVMAEHRPERVLPVGTWHAGRIAVLRAQQRHEEAVSVAEDLLERLAQRHHAGIRLREHAAEAFLDAGDYQRAALVAAEGISVGRRWGAPSALAPHLRIQGLALGEEESLREAAELVQDGPFRIEAARCLLALGAHLRRTRRRTEARDPLRRALHLAQSSGAEPLAEQALVELRATGARPRSALLTGVESLTPSELRVATLVAGGASNPEVASTLYVSRSTVESHLRAVFRKLEISDRGALAAALGEGSQKITEAP
jgi:ATP/maltotriose-dependent transcriptional regulator MalT